MTGRPDETYDPTRHPDLLRWLDGRECAHEDWARQASPESELDFGPESLELLDALVRQAATSSQEITEQRMTPFVQGAIWYTGEVFRRHRDMVWKYVPDNLDGELHPFFGADVETTALDHPCVGDPGDTERHLYMLNMIRGIFLTEDDFGDPVVNTLPSLYADPYGEGDTDDDDDDEDDESDESDEND